MAEAPKYSKAHIENYVKNHTFHDSICGFDHVKRVHALAKKLGKEYDPNVLHAACFLHDIKANAKDHHLRSAEVAEQAIGETLPLHKIHEVKQAIIHHGLDGKPKSPEAILLHDADLLDYLGAVGFIRLALAARDWYDKKDIYEILKLIRVMKDRIADALILNQSKSKAADLLNIMDLTILQVEEELG